MLWYRVCQWGKGEKTDVTAPVGNSLEPQPTLIGALRRIPGFRIDRRKKLPLHEILAIAVCAVISGATGFRDYERFGREKRKWLKRFLRLENGIPSHDTFARVFSLMDPKRFNAVVVDWFRSVVDVEGDVISVDGKILRRAFTKAGKRPCIVSAHSHRTKLVIGQVKADEKSNEITAIPELLDLLYLKGAIVTIDAAGCQRKTVKKIVRRGAHYLISLKGSQSTMHDEIKAFMDDRTLQKDFDKAVSVTLKTAVETCPRASYLNTETQRHRGLCRYDGKSANLISPHLVKLEFS